MSDVRRVQRAEKELREIVASYVVRNFAADFLSVTQVRVTRDLRGAKIYVCALGKPKVSSEKLEELQERAPDIQREVTKQLRMRYCPKITFANDEGTAAATKVDELLTQIKR